MIVVGESGTGKTTFVKSFLNKMQKRNNTNINESSTNENSYSICFQNNLNEKKNLTLNLIEDIIFENSMEKKFNSFDSTLSFTSHTVKHSTNNKQNLFTIIDSEGYGQSLNNKKWLQQLINYFKKRVIIILIRMILIIT